MRFALITAAAALTASAFAAPEAEAVPKPLCRAGVSRPGCVAKARGPPSNKPVAGQTCMSDEDAAIVADTFKSLIRGYTKEQATAALTEDFVDYSSAVSIVINKGAAVPKDITQPIFTSRAQFMEGHGKQQPIPFETLDVWHNCNGTVSMRWLTTRSAQGQATETAAIPVPGLVILETEPAEEGNIYNYRIHTIYSEFNSAAWLVNLGVFDPEGEVTPVPASKRDTAITGRGAPAGHWYDVGMI